jgi:RNase adaptor protein for sRNA GlmZ degradation
MKSTVLIRSLVPLLKNKYLLSLVIFFAWIVFIDENNLMERSKNIRQIHALERDKLYYEKKIREDREKLEELEGSVEKFEKFAREQYLMKRENEDIFIIEK